MRRFNVEMRHEQDDHNVWHTELEEIECDGGKYMDAKEVLAALWEAWEEGDMFGVENYKYGATKAEREGAFNDFLKQKGIEP